MRRPSSLPSHSTEQQVPRTAQDSGAELILALTIMLPPAFGSEGAQPGAKLQLLMTKAIGETFTFCF